MNKPTNKYFMNRICDMTYCRFLFRGKLCFWDGDSGTSIASHQSHKADVLCICLDEQQTTVYAAGKPIIFQ